MALADVKKWKDVGVDANTLAILTLDEANAADTWDNFEGDANWDGKPAAANEPQVSTIVPNSNFVRSRVFNNDDYGYIVNPVEFPTGEFTVELMLRLATASAVDTEGVVCQYPPTAGDRSFIIQRDTTDKLTCGVSQNGSNFVYITSAALSAGVWHYIAFVYKPSTYLRVYVDGALSAEVTTGVPSSVRDSSADVVIGRYNSSWGANNALDGHICDLRFSNKARTSTEISDHWAGTDGGGGGGTPNYDALFAFGGV